jgi:hypothetical protein
MHPTEDDPLPAPRELREETLRRLRGIVHAPRADLREAVQAARVILQQMGDYQDPMADLAKRLGSDKAALLEWMRGNVATLEAELAKELPAATPAGEPSLPPTPPARAEDAEPQ